MTVNAPPTVVAPPTFRSSPIARLFSNLEVEANFAAPVNVEIPVIVAAAPTFKSLLNVDPNETIMSVADADRNVVNPAVTFNSSAFALPSFVYDPVPTL